MNKGKFLMHNQ